VREFIAKIARFAVSKGAAFSYAVAVGVAGNVIFHYVQPRDAVPAVAPVPYEARPSGDAGAWQDFESERTEPLNVPRLQRSKATKAS